MGARGPSPKPTAMRILEGNPSRRPIDENEPHPEIGATAPPWLTFEARKEWDRLEPILSNCGLLTKADQDCLAIYCDALVNYKLVSQRIAESLVLVGHNGKAIPEIGIQKNYAELIVKFGSRLGLSPSDRTGLKTNPQKRESKWSQKLSA